MKTGRLNGKVSIVTGGAEGIGRATANLFALEGARTIIADKNRPLGERAAEEIRSEGGEALFLPLDVTSDDNWGSCMKETVRAFGKLNIV